MIPTPPPVKGTIPTEDFRGPHLKIERAIHHIDDLHKVLERFLRLQSYSAVADFELEPGSIIWVARGRDLFPHDEFSPIVGDIVHNLRSALDVATSILMRNAGRSDSKVYFPIFESFEEFRDSIIEQKGRRRQRIPRLPEHVISALEHGVQPYRGGNGHDLIALNKLSNVDKHRLITPTVFGVNVMHMKADETYVPIRFFNTPTTIRDGARLARIKASDWPEVKSGQESPLTLAITFDDQSGPLRGESIDDGTQRLLRAAINALKGLQICL